MEGSRGQRDEFSWTSLIPDLVSFIRSLDDRMPGEAEDLLEDLCLSNSTLHSLPAIRAHATQAKGIVSRAAD